MTWQVVEPITLVFDKKKDLLSLETKIFREKSIREYNFLTILVKFYNLRVLLLLSSYCFLMGPKG